MCACPPAKKCLQTASQFKAPTKSVQILLGKLCYIPDHQLSPMFSCLSRGLCANVNLKHWRAREQTNHGMPGSTPERQTLTWRKIIKTLFGFSTNSLVNLFVK